MLPEQYSGNDAIGVTRWPASVSCGSAANKALTPVSVQIGMAVERVSARAATPCTETGVSPCHRSHVDRGFDGPAPRVKTRETAQIADQKTSAYSANQLVDKEPNSSRLLSTHDQHLESLIG